MVILSRWVFGIFGGGALVALIFLLAQNTMRHTSVLSSLGLLSTPSSPVFVTPTSNELFLLPTSTGMPWHTTSFVEENPVVFSEFVAPVESVTSTIQVALVVPIVSSTTAIASSTEVVVSSTMPIIIVPPLVESSVTTLETQVVTAGAAAPVNISIEPLLCVGTSSTPSRVVRINELAWMGTKNGSTSFDKAQDKSLTAGSYTDEWIELYNTSSSSFSLIGAQLVASSSKSFFSVRFGDNDVISSNGYFLLERTNDTSVPNIVADKIYTGALNDDDEVVELFGGECNSLDRVDFKKDFPIVSTNVDRRSMELKQDGVFALYDGDADVVSGIFGSSRRENSYRTVEIASSTAETVASSTEIASVPTSTVEIVLQEVSVSSTLSVVINEILFDGDGSDRGKEFVELYNSSDTDQDLKGWSLRLLKTAATSTASLATFGDNLDDHTTIPSHGFLLVGLNGYDIINFNGVTADVRRSNILPNGNEEISVILFDSNKNEIDRIVYIAQSILKEGQSLERNGVGVFVMNDRPSPQNTSFTP